MLNADAYEVLQSDRHEGIEGPGQFCNKWRSMLPAYFRILRQVTEVKKLPLNFIKNSEPMKSDY